MIYGVVFGLLIYEYMNIFQLIMLQGNGYFCEFFQWVCSGESTTFLYVTNYHFWCKFRAFSLLLLSGLNEWRRCIAKQLAGLIQKSLNQLILRIKIRRYLKSLLVHITRKILQDQEKQTKINENQIKHKQIKPKLKPKKNNNHKNRKSKKSQKNLCQKKKLMLANKNCLALFANGLQKRVKQTGFFVECAQCGSKKIVVVMKSYVSNFTPSI